MTTTVIDTDPQRRIVIDHVTLRVRDLDASRSFYVAALRPLGMELLYDKNGALGFGLPGLDDFGMNRGDPPTTGLHLAFSAPSKEAVDAFYGAALAHGARDNGPPGPRPQYHAGYYGAFVLDLEGNNVEAVFHGPRGEPTIGGTA